MLARWWHAGAFCLGVALVRLLFILLARRVTLVWKLAHFFEREHDAMKISQALREIGATTVFSSFTKMAGFALSCSHLFVQISLPLQPQ